MTDTPTSTDDDPADDELAYVGAVAELETILAELEGDEVDIDVLGARVRRAAHLIRLCRDRVATARMEVEQVVADLDEDDGDPA
jgi:exodeoxyribonuclease VII small subunit